MTVVCHMYVSLYPLLLLLLLKKRFETYTMSVVGPSIIIALVRVPLRGMVVTSRLSELRVRVQCGVQSNNWLGR